MATYKISKEDLDYFVQLKNEYMKTCMLITEKEMELRNSVDRAMELRIGETSFIGQLYTKYDLPREKSFDIDLNTGELTFQGEDK